MISTPAVLMFDILLFCTRGVLPFHTQAVREGSLGVRLSNSTVLLAPQEFSKLAAVTAHHTINYCFDSAPSTHPVPLSAYSKASMPYGSDSFWRACGFHLV